MGDINKTELVNPNINVGGFNTFLPILEELLLYKEFFRGKSIWSKTKRRYWNHEKAILAWAYSERHQHLGNPIDSQRVKEMYGFTEISKEEVTQDRGCELSVNNSSELVENMKESHGDLINPLLGNLVQKGLAFVLKRYEDSERRETPYVAAIMISREGLIVGKLVSLEQKRFGLLGYKFLSLAINIFIVIGLIVLIYTMFSQIWEMIQPLIDLIN